MPKIAEVAVGIGKNKFLIFDYQVPDNKYDRLCPGWRVLVPVRDQLCEGLVLNVGNSGSKHNLRHINSLVGDGPYIDTHMIGIANWISEYYLIPIEETLDLIFPSYVRGKWTRRYERLVEPAGMRSQAALNPDFSMLIEYISNKKSFSENTLINKFGKRIKLGGYLNDLVNRGYLKQKDDFKTSTSYQRQNDFVILLLDEKEVDEFIMCNRRAHKQIETLELLKHRERPPRVKDLLTEAKTSMGVIRELEKKNAIGITDQHIYMSSANIKTNSIRLSTEQENSLNAIKKAVKDDAFKAFLLHGVTGSGKTEVYMRAVRYAMELGKQSIVIVPEIALASQVVKLFYRHFGYKAALMHSKLSDGKRYRHWEGIRKGEIKVVIGTRSSVFAPIPNLGLIILDEEQEGSLKQENNPRYHARKIAEMRCRMEDAVLLLGSATPSLETYYRSKKGEIQKLRLRERVGGGTLPIIETVDMREELRKGNSSILSTTLQDNIEKTLVKGEQIILFLNRRGYAAFIQCRDCGFVVHCKHCDVTLTYHSYNETLRCHYCGFTTAVPVKCPNCTSRRVKSFGIGTQKVEEVIKERYGRARVVRMDADTTSRRDAHRKILDSFSQGKKDIMIGTQMVAKGFDFPNVTLVCAVAADMGLNLPDFRSGERTYQLLSQVAGRAGRGHKQGKVIIQTYNPENLSFVYLRHHDLKSYYEQELARRKSLDYPPFSGFIRVILSGPKEASVIQCANEICDELLSYGIKSLGPAPAPIDKIKGLHRWHVILRSNEKKTKKILYDTVKNKKVGTSLGTSISIDVDPQSLI
ncbi:MAG: primosomal protein N' [Clostridia bacterium]|nr:primosomal protein N' [Clostridia bacterium]